MKEQLLIDCCPICSHLRADHPSLLDDILAFPSIMFSAPSTERRYRDGKYRVIGCPHVRPIFGPWPTEDAARQAIRERFAALRLERQALYETSTQRQEPSGADGTAEAETATLPLQEPREAERVCEGLASSPSAEPGAGDETVACEVGNSVWMSHDLDWTMKCKRCGFQAPEIRA